MKDNQPWPAEAVKLWRDAADGRRMDIDSPPAKPAQLAQTMRAHGGIENSHAAASGLRRRRRRKISPSCAESHSIF
ncbi:hypothetical protein [Massilia glaciei]|uniref:hypothetical protein n=1 Tax=Massilia glaciei TaxID=1524097 RepID=UPI0011B1E164|nr:hypothetical protein [Massilia glaciei]